MLHQCGDRTGALPVDKDRISADGIPARAVAPVRQCLTSVRRIGTDANVPQEQ
jgi:hypothetical protein